MNHKKFEDAIQVVRLEQPLAEAVRVGKKWQVTCAEGALSDLAKDHYDAWINAAGRMAERDRAEMEKLYASKSCSFGMSRGYGKVEAI